MSSLSAIRKAAGMAWRRSREAFNRMGDRARPPFKHRLIFEALERRLLLSADFNPAFAEFANAGEDISFIAQDADLRARILAPAQLPLAFQPNLGQARAETAFLSQAAGYTLFLTPSAGAIRFTGEQGAGAAVRMEPVGATAAPTATGVERLAG